MSRRPVGRSSGTGRARDTKGTTRNGPDATKRRRRRSSASLRSGPSAFGGRRRFRGATGGFQLSVLGSRGERVFGAGEQAGVECAIVADRAGARRDRERPAFPV